MVLNTSAVKQNRKASGMCWSSLKQKLNRSSKGKMVRPWHFEKRKLVNRPKITLDSVTLGWAKQYWSKRQSPTHGVMTKTSKQSRHKSV